MKKLLVTLLFIGIVSPTVFAGGIVTNANQSAAYIRMPAQDATLNIDAVYYNPAGLAFMPDGFYVSISNQYIKQTRTITSSFPGMNRTQFEGGVVAPLFPSVYMALVKDKVAFSLGFNPIGGGGSAIFEEGLPSFEQNFAAIPPALTAGGINTSAYSFNSEFEGRSLMYGFQANASYAINDMISFSLGVRFVIAQNFYKGNYTNVMINPDVPGTFPAPMQAAYAGNMVSASTFFTDFAAFLTTTRTQALGTATSLGSTPAATPFSALPQANQDGIMALLGAGGITTTPATVGDAITALGTAATNIGAKATEMTITSAKTKDAYVDTEQSGTGISPIIGIDVKVNEKLNIGFRYEHRTKINVKNKTVKDDVKLYPDGATYPNDLPTTISLGASYKATQKLSLSAGAHYYFDKTAAYGKVKTRDANGMPISFYENDEIIDNNFLELAFGAEYSINDKILISGGYLRTQTGVNLKYQSDLSHSLSTNTVGLGGRYMVTPNIGVNLGGMMSFYLKETKNFDIPTIYDETYKRSALVLAIGVDLKF